MPLRERSNFDSRVTIGEVRLIIDVQILAGDSQGMVYGIGTTVCTDRYCDELATLRVRIENSPFRRRIVL